MFGSKCPDCDYPMDGDETFCPRCQRMRTSHDFSFADEYRTYIIMGVILFVFGCIFAYDYNNGTEFLPKVWDFLGGATE